MISIIWVLVLAIVVIGFTQRRGRIIFQSSSKKAQVYFVGRRVSG